MSVRQVTRHLWHVFDGERLLGAVLRVNGERDTSYVSQPDGAPRSAWLAWDTFDLAESALRRGAAPECTCETIGECLVCRPETEEEEAAEEGAASRWAALEID